VKNEDKLKYWAECILESIYYIHSQGFIHVDLKLENVLMSNGDNPAEEYCIPKVCDFGLSHILDNQEKAYMEVLCGTHGYMAPEQKAVSDFNLDPIEFLYNSCRGHVGIRDSIIRAMRCL
jgi:serine/threonine protein kinase